MEKIDQIEQAHDLAIRLRSEFERLNSDKTAAARLGHWIANSNFPKGWCELSAQILGRQIARHLRIHEIDLCTGYSSDRVGSHSWIRIFGKHHIDITLDQFDSNIDPVVAYSGTGIHESMHDEITYIPLVSACVKHTYFERTLFKLDVLLDKRTSVWRSIDQQTRFAERS